MLIDQFGVTGTEAFNLIVQGAQSGLNKNGDLLDSINEYSVHFKQLGIGAEGMFNAFSNGAFSGTFSVDKLGDAVKEFGIRVKDGTGDEAFKTLGLSANNIKKAFTQGGEAGQKAFEQVTQKLFAMQDPVKQNTLGVQLFGTMWEDLGMEGVKALSDITGEFDKTYDAMNQVKNVQYNDVGSALEGLKRTLVSNIVLPISENITPAVGDAVNRLREAFGDGGPLSGMADAFGGKLSQAIKKTVDLMASAVETGKNIYQKNTLNT